MKPFRDENELAAELRALRPSPSPAFAAALDERAAAGFPRRPPLADRRLGSVAAWLRSVPPRRIALSAGVATLASVAIATAVVVGTEPSGNNPQGAHPHSGGALLGEIAPAPSTSAASNESASAGESAGTAESGSQAGYNGSGPYVSGRAHRDVERSARIVLGADPTEVGADAARVAETVHAYDGIVLRSSTRNGSEGAGAAFELLIPSAKLGDAMASFAQIGEVRLRHEATADITAPTVGVAERLRDSRARIDSLLAQLAAAETESERQAVEAELAAERHHHAALHSRLAALRRRAHFSHVSLRIESGKGPAASSGGWGIDDALRDAGHVLAVAAGVTIVGLAALAPLALLALLVWLGRRVWVRRGRERALT